MMYMQAVWYGLVTVGKAPGLSETGERENLV